MSLSFQPTLEPGVEPKATPEKSESRLNLRIVRGPLLPRENVGILSEYNRLKASQIPLHEFLNWIQNSPEGPAWHAILETDNGDIVGHQSLIPFRATCQGRRFVAAKSEYAFLREEFQAGKIRGLEEARGPKHIIAARRLFQHGEAQGWGPYLICNAAAARQRRGFYGFTSTDFHLWECLLVLRPWRAASETANLANWQRPLLGLAGMVQQLAWAPRGLIFSGRAGIRSVSVDDRILPHENGSLRFFEDQESLKWRYLEAQYERLALDAEGREFVIVKKGSRNAYIRVCQWRLGSDQPAISLVDNLVQMAQKERALGIRWAIYGDDAAGAAVVRRLRRFGFLCARRVRTLLIKSNEKEFLAAEKWHLNDAIFSFHL
jgi:hypothetical protein